MLENFKNTVKSVFKFIWNHAVSALKALLDEIIIFLQDLVKALNCTRMNWRKPNKIKTAAIDNWYKFAKYIGACVVIFGGLNLSLGAISFVVLALFVSKFISVSLSSSDNSKAKKLRKAYTVCRVLQVLLPVIAAFVLVSNWWLLILGLIATLIGGFKDRQHSEKEKKETEDISSKDKDKNTNDNKIDEKENNFDLRNIGSHIPSAVANGLANNPAEQKILEGVGRSVWSNLKSKLGNELKDLKGFFYPELDNVQGRNVEIK